MSKIFYILIPPNVSLSFIQDVFNSEERYMLDTYSTLEAAKRSLKLLTENGNERKIVKYTITLEEVE